MEIKLLSDETRKANILDDGTRDAPFLQHYISRIYTHP